jgi:hypothetical protein
VVGNTILAVFRVGQGEISEGCGRVVWPGARSVQSRRTLAEHQKKMEIRGRLKGWSCEGFEGGVSVSGRKVERERESGVKWRRRE